MFPAYVFCLCRLYARRRYKSKAHDIFRAELEYDERKEDRYTEIHIPVKLEK